MRVLKTFVIGVSFLVQVTSFAAARFPRSPDPTLTPGLPLCQKPSEYRYPERIPYCTRNVSSSLKRSVMEAYDSKLGYEVTKMNRNEFKIDHYIPLCMGGSNEASNLWPQHSSIYQFTDQLEFELCKKMAEGTLLQADAIEIIKKAKADPGHCQTLLMSYNRP